MSNHIQWLESKKRLLPTTYLSAQSCVGDMDVSRSMNGMGLALVQHPPPRLSTCKHFPVSQRRTLCGKGQSIQNIFSGRRSIQGACRWSLALESVSPEGLQGRIRCGSLIQGGLWWVPKEEGLGLGGAAGLPQAEVRSLWKGWAHGQLRSCCKLEPRGFQL